LVAISPRCDCAAGIHENVIDAQGESAVVCEGREKRSVTSSRKACDRARKEYVVMYMSLAREKQYKYVSEEANYTAIKRMREG